MIYGFMHVALMNNGYDIFKEQVEKIQYSGLYDKCEKIFIGCVHSEKSSKSYFEDLPDKFIQVVDCPDISMFELLTLNYLISFCTNNANAKIWYIHTKGVSIPDHVPKMYWRKYMEYFNIVKYEDCIKVLEDYDVCGVEGSAIRNETFVGNFWWANSNYVKQLKLLDLGSRSKIGTNNFRHLAERFLGSGCPNKKSFFDTYYKLNSVKIKPSEYIKIKM